MLAICNLDVEVGDIVVAEGPGCRAGEAGAAFLPGPDVYAPLCQRFVRREIAFPAVDQRAGVLRSVFEAEQVLESSQAAAVGNETVQLGARFLVGADMGLPGAGAVTGVLPEDDVDEYAFGAHVEAGRGAANDLDAIDRLCLDALHGRRDIIGFAGQPFAVNQYLVSARPETASLAAATTTSAAESASRNDVAGPRNPAKHVEGADRVVMLEKARVIRNGRPVLGCLDSGRRVSGPLLSQCGGQRQYCCCNK